jgi:6-phosphogluconolactonase/glucosamine-6-phosphate isomerase/deaminase
VSGEAKRPVYERIFAGQQEDPAARVTPTDGVLSWILAE